MSFVANLNEPKTLQNAQHSTKHLANDVPKNVISQLPNFIFIFTSI